MSFESKNSFFSNFPNPLCSLPHICFKLINSWCCLIFHVYIFDLILSVSLLCCTDTLTADIDTTTITSVVPCLLNDDLVIQCVSEDTTVDHSYYKELEKLSIKSLTMTVHIIDQLQYFMTLFTVTRALPFLLEGQMT